MYRGQRPKQSVSHILIIQIDEGDDGTTFSRAGRLGTDAHFSKYLCACLSRLASMFILCYFQSRALAGKCLLLHASLPPNFIGLLPQAAACYQHMLRRRYARLATYFLLPSNILPHDFAMMLAKPPMFQDFHAAAPQPLLLLPVTMPMFHFAYGAPHLSLAPTI